MSQRHWFTPSGAIARILAVAARHAPEGADVFLAACYGIVEICGVSRVFVPAIKGMAQTIIQRIREVQQSANKPRS